MEMAPRGREAAKSEATSRHRTRRQDMRSGLRVTMTSKRDQQRGRLTSGIMKNVLTKPASHPHGITGRGRRSHEEEQACDQCPTALSGLPSEAR
jgi:uncharacterized repeat protein (TIGR03833 family)